MLDILTQDPRPLPRRARGVVPVPPARNAGPAGDRIARGEAGHGTRYPAPTGDGTSMRVRTTPYGDDFTDAIIASEVYRAHTQPHLYALDPDKGSWQLDLIEDNWLDLIGGRASIDCARCHKARAIDTEDEICPVCGWEVP